MSSQPSSSELLLNRYADTLAQIVHSILEQDHIALVDVLEPLKADGWVALCEAVVRIFEGERDLEEFENLDEDDTALAQAIINGLEDPDSLPEKREELLAIPLDAEQLAQTILDARKEQAKALRFMEALRDQLQDQPESKPRLGKNLLKMANGENDVELLKEKLEWEDALLIDRIFHYLNKSSQS